MNELIHVFYKSLKVISHFFVYFFAKCLCRKEACDANRDTAGANVDKGWGVHADMVYSDYTFGL